MGTELADTQLISLIKDLDFYCVLLIFLVNVIGLFLWKIKDVSIANEFQKVLDKSGRTPNKKWVDKGNEFYNNSLKKWLKYNYIEMYSIHNEGKSVVAERFRTLKPKVYKYMASISKNVYIDKLDDIVKGIK